MSSNNIHTLINKYSPHTKMLQTILVLWLSAIAGIKSATISRECSVNINGGLGTPQPLYTHGNASKFVQTIPNFSAIRVLHGQSIEVHCPGGFRGQGGGGKVTKKIAKCLSNDQFMVDGKSLRLRQLACSNHPVHKAKYTNSTCSVGDLIEIGFTVQKNWMPTLAICHDDWDGSTKWTHHKLTPANALHQRSVSRPQFSPAQFYKGIDPDTLYRRHVQLETLSKILKSEKLANALVQRDSDFFLSRGHLAAKSDMVLASHQFTTFYYINAAPQWLSFNNGNWLQVEISLKSFVLKRNIDVDVYTGTDGIVSYADVKGKYQPIYMSVSDPKRPRIPVPKLYYKVVVAPALKSGIVLIGVNDPHASKDRIQSEYVLCPDISDQINYITWNRKNITAGYSYACTVDQFTKVVKHLPDFTNVTELLL